MSIYNRTNCFLSRLKCLANTTLKHHIKLYSRASGGFVDTSNWKKLDSTTVGITRSLIPLPTWTVLNSLHRRGFEAYLVGGCVRDLVLNRTPKDFDVVTNANLKQIKKLSQHAIIVGRKFPICMVRVKGSVVEVSSFYTVADGAKQKKGANFTEGHLGCDKRDFVRWRDCIRRDFTINSLFFDPFANIIYDYAGGMKDLKSLKLRTLVPAQLSFKEDCARILRGLRIAARLGLSFSDDTETAIYSLSPSIMSLSKPRIMMELNYMLSYGAAGPSICLLQRFDLLRLLLPLQAAYLAQQPDEETAKCSTMLMKLFSNLDKILHCDRPSDCILWLGLLAFHQALVINPQDALVICTFSSILHCGGWVEGVKFAKEHAEAHVSFVPEVLEACHHKSNEELAEDIMQLATLVNDSIKALTGEQSFSRSISGYPSFPHSGLVFVSNKMANNAAQIFKVALNDIEYYEEQRKSLDIDYDLLGKGDPRETRYVIGKIIVDTMMGEVIQGITDTAEGQRQHQKEVGPVLQQFVGDNDHIDPFNPLKNAVDIKESGRFKSKQVLDDAHSSPDAIPKHKKQKRFKNGMKRVRKWALSQSSAVPDFTEKKVVKSGLKKIEDEKHILTPSSAVPKQKRRKMVDIASGRKEVATPMELKFVKNAGKVDEGGQEGTISPSVAVRKDKMQDLCQNKTQDAVEKTKLKGGPAMLSSLFR